MNERERFIRTLTCRGPDRPSYGDYFAYDSTRQRWEREGLPKGLDHGGLFDYFGLDHLEIWGRDRLPIHAGIIPPFEEALIEEVGWWPRWTTVFRPTSRWAITATSGTCCEGCVRSSRPAGRFRW